MAQTSSTMLELGTTAPDFSLPDTDGNSVSRKDFRNAPGLLVVFMCNHCPDVEHIREALVAFAREYESKGLAVVGINANDADNYPDDGPDKMARQAADFGYTFPYLFDRTQRVAKAYRAACTPDFFLFDKRHKLVYRGRFDDSRPRNDRPVTGQDLRAAADALLSGRAVDPDQKPSSGCNIKWKIGNEPDYFRWIRLKPHVKGPPKPKSDEKIPDGGFSRPRKKANPTPPPDDRRLEEIGESIRARIDDWLAEKTLAEPPVVHDTELRERVARLEKELKSQRESVRQGFNLMERRFEAMDGRLDILTRRMQRFGAWSLGVTVGVGFVVIAALRFWPA